MFIIILIYWSRKLFQQPRRIAGAAHGGDGAGLGAGLAPVGGPVEGGWLLRRGVEHLTTTGDGNPATCARSKEVLEADAGQSRSVHQFGVGQGSFDGGFE